MHFNNFNKRERRDHRSPGSSARCIECISDSIGSIHTAIYFTIVLGKNRIESNYVALGVVCYSSNLLI